MLPSPQDLLAKVQGGPASPPLFSTQAPTTSSIPSPADLLAKTQQQNPAPSFASNLLSTAKSFVSKAASAVGGFLGTQASNIGAAATGQVKVTPADLLEGVKKTASGIGSGIESLALGFNEGVARIGKSALEATVGPEITSKIAASPIGGFAKTATGRENFIPDALTEKLTGQIPEAPSQAGTPLLSYQEIYDKAHGYAINNNATTHEASTFAGLAVVGSLFADNPIIGPEASAGKGLFKLSEDAVSTLAKTSEEDAIKAILKAENPGITATELEAMAPVFKNAANDAEVKAAAEQISKIQDAAIQAKSLPKKEDVPAPAEILDRAQKNLEIPKAITEAAPEKPLPYFRSVADDTGKTTKFLPVEGQSVKLLDGLETFIHQPEKGAYEVMEASTGRQIGKAGATPEEAIQSAQEALQGKTLQDVQGAIQKHDLAPRGAPTPPEPRLAAPQPFDTNLVRSISQEEQAGPIVDTLRKEFPALSDQALAPIAGRLAKLHRTGDIEGILQIVRNVSRDIEAARAGTKSGGKAISINPIDVGESIAKVGERKIAGDLPASIGELLTSAERGRYLDNVSRVIKDPESAVLAQQEYDALWEHADQRIIDRYEELKTYRDIMREQIDIHPGKDINALYKGTFLSPSDVQLDELIEQRRGRGIDSKIGEIMGGQDQPGVADTVAQGQEALDSFFAMRTQLSEIEAEMRDIRPKARAARILQSMVEDVPVISRAHAGRIEALAIPEYVRGYKDISGFMGQARDVYRNFEAVFGDKFAEVKKIILDPFDKSKGAMVDEIKGLGDRIEENIIKKYGIERGSKESAAMQLYGEGLISHEELITKVGSDKVEGIIASTGWMRKEYDRLLDEVNEVRARIFPNDPNKLIPKRKDYFRHFQEMSNGFRDLISVFESPAGIDPALAGLSEWTKPKSKFISFAQERIGKDTTVDAVGGFLDYAPTFAYAKHIDQHIGNFRYLRRRLADNAPTPGVRELVPAANEEAAAMGAQDLVKQPGINNFLEYLDNYANDLAGKTNPMDRYLQMVVPGGRKTFKVISWINSRVKANAILGNLSSAVAQVFNVPNGIASAKLYSLPGISRTLSSFITKNEPMEASAFIKERFKEDLASRFKIDWVDHPIRGTTERARDMAVWITQAGDEVGTKFIWNAHYAKAIAEGAEDPIKYADDITRQMVAGRGVGEVPLGQKSKIFQLVAPFQVEVGNAWFVMSKFVKQKDFGAIATLLVANYLMNRVAQDVRGSPVVFDPIESVIEGATQASDEMSQDGNAGRAAFKFVGRQVGELLSNVPLGQTIAAAVPDSWVQGATQAATGAPIPKKEIFGSADPGRFGGGLLTINGLTDPLYRLIPPFGGIQAKRTIEGVTSMLQGQVKDSKGQVSFKTTPTITNVIQATLFGKNATAEAQAFYNSRDDLFQRTYNQTATRTADSLEAEATWADLKKLPKDQAIAQLQELDAKNPTLAAAVVAVGKAEKQGLDGNDRLVAMLGVANGERAKYIVDQLNGIKANPDKVAFLSNLNDKGLLTQDVFKQVAAMIKAPKNTPQITNGTHSVSGVLNTVITYAAALGTDPGTAFNRIFTGQTIERIDNGTIIVKRMSFKDSEAVKKADGGVNGYNGMNLDHTIPLELGGSNDKGNLKLVPEATWASYTPIENLLGQALRSKVITKQTAQDLITKFKAGELTADEVKSKVAGK